MSTVSSRSSHQYQNNHPAQSSSSAGSRSSRRLSSIRFSASPVNGRFTDRRFSVAKDLQPNASSDDRSTEMITIALAKAQNAVLLDQRNNVTAALDGYSQCCAILAEVIAKETDSDDITRLRQIHDTYSVRMHVLSSMQLEPNSIAREMPPLPTKADLEDFEDEEDEEELVNSVRHSKLGSGPNPAPRQDYRSTDVRASTLNTPRQSLRRSSSSRESTVTSRFPPSVRTSSHSRTSSYTRVLSHDSVFSSLEQISSPRSTWTFRSSIKRDNVSLPEMIDEEMDDVAFLERITRGFESDEEIHEDEPVRPSTSSTVSSLGQHQPKKPSELFILNEPMVRTESQGDLVLPSPNGTVTPTPRQPSPAPPTPKHDRIRNTSSPLPTSGDTMSRLSSTKKNLSVGAAQPMLKSLSANSAIPPSDETSAATDSESSVKSKKRPQLIRVVSESTMRTTRLSTFEVSPNSPPSAGSILTPGTSSSSFLTDGPGARNFIAHDRVGAAPPEDPPEDPYLRPYWLMRALTNSMKNQKGAYINMRLFVPQGVWTLKNVKLKATEEKIGCCNTVTQAVRQVLETDQKNLTMLLQEVAGLEGTLDLVQQNLQRKIEGKTNGSNGTNGDGKTMTRKMSQSTLLGGWGKRLRSKSSASSIPTLTQTSGKDVGLDGTYPNAILVLFESALDLEQKFESLDPEDMPIKTQLRLDASRRRIAEFFANVVIRFVVQDLSTLMNKYVKRVNEWILS